MFPIRSILVPTDFSADSANALALASALARDHGARIVLLHVAAEATFAAGMGMVPFDSFTYRDELLGKLAQEAERCAGVPVEQRLAEGKAVAEILRAAEETGCDLIVMASHGWSGLRRLLMGGVAEGVLRQAPCPVLTVRSEVPLPVETVSAPARAAAE